MVIDLGASGQLGATGQEETAVAAALHSDVCILGAGVAGLLLADRLREHATVTLLEAGGLRSEEQEGADPFRAVLAGVPHAGTRVGRVRAFGGCSLTWGGQLLGLPEDANWPVTAMELREGGAPWGDVDDSTGALTAHKLVIPGLLRFLPGLTPRLSRFLPFSLRNLAKVPGRSLLRAQRVKVVMRAHATRLVLNEVCDRVVGVELVTASGKTLRVTADQYVVAAGTVETCRLLLVSREAACGGDARGLAQVGHNFHDHLTLAAAVFAGPARERILRELRPWILKQGKQGRLVYSMKLEPTHKLRQELGLHRAMVHLTVEEPANSGIGRLRDVLRRHQAQRVVERRSTPFWRVLPRIVMQAARLFWEARRRRRRYVSPEATVKLQLNLAQDAPSASTVSLSSFADDRGMRRAVVDWRISAAELSSLRRLTRYLKEQLEAAGIDEGVLWEDALLHGGPASDTELAGKVEDARHAMGGACMGVDPGSSVVDAELRVHGIANLWVASAAVFPDGAAQLPTLTLGALCLRLAKKLRRELRGA